MLLAVSVVLVVAAGGSLLLTPWVRQLALARGVFDYPGHRKVHQRPIPRLGGLAVFVAWVIAVGLVSRLDIMREIDLFHRTIPIFVAAAGSVFLGLWDDLRDLSGRGKLLGQLLLGMVLIASDLRIDRISSPFGGELLFPFWLSVVVTLLWVAGMMNAMNLIDGLDGLAAGITTFAALGLVAAGLYADSPISVVLFAGLAGSCVGFLRYNFPPAKIFLGDAGSQFLGLMLAAIPLVGSQYKSATAVALLIPLTALSLPIYDTALAALRRLRGRRSIFRADKSHLHHRLLSMGLSQRQAVVFLYLASAYLSVLAFLFVLIEKHYALILLVLLALGFSIAMQALRFIEFSLHRRIRRRRHAGTDKRE